METTETVRFGDSRYADHFVWHEGSTGVGRYIEEMVDHFHFLSGEFRLIPQASRIQGKVISRRGTEPTLCFRPLQLSGGMLNGLGEWNSRDGRSDVGLIHRWTGSDRCESHREEDSPELCSSPLAINHCFNDARNRQYSQAIVMIVFGVRVRCTWFKPPTISRQTVTSSKVLNLSWPQFSHQKMR